MNIRIRPGASLLDVLREVAAVPTGGPTTRRTVPPATLYWSGWPIWSVGSTSQWRGARAGQLRRGARPDRYPRLPPDDRAAGRGGTWWVGVPARAVRRRPIHGRDRRTEPGAPPARHSARPDRRPRRWTLLLTVFNIGVHPCGNARWRHGGLP